MVKDFKDIIRSKKKSSIKQDEALGNFFNGLTDPNINFSKWTKTALIFTSDLLTGKIRHSKSNFKINNHLNISKNNFDLEMAI